MPKIKLICVVCGNEYEKYPSQATRSKCCSRACAQKYAANRDAKKTGENRLCLMCGNNYYINKYTANNKNKVSKFCSKACKDKYHSINDVGEKSNLYKNGKYQGRGANWYKQRELVRKRDNYICQICGCTPKKKLTVHHIKPFDTFNNYLEANKLENLIGLCEGCHTSVHNEAKKLNETKNTDYIIRQLRAEHN